jgi:hypothetical protein
VRVKLKNLFLVILPIISLYNKKEIYGLIFMAPYIPGSGGSVIEGKGW